MDTGGERSNSPEEFELRGAPTRLQCDSARESAGLPNTILKESRSNMR